MSDFLDKVALRVSKWGCGPMPGVWVYSDSTPDITARSLDQSETVNEQQWLQRRKELINEPDDKDAPEWAKWKAQDANGIWHWYRGDKPIASKAQWDVPCGGAVSVATSGKIPAGHDWRNTLRKVERKSFDGVDVSELPHCFGVDFGAETNGLGSIQTLCMLIDTTDDHIAKLMLQTALAQVLEREYGVEIGYE